MGTDQRDTRQALGQPAGFPDDTSTHQPDIAGEHEDTAVDKQIVADDERLREPESPRGWAGMDPDAG